MYISVAISYFSYSRFSYVEEMQLSDMEQLIAIPLFKDFNVSKEMHL